MPREPTRQLGSRAVAPPPIAGPRPAVPAPPPLASGRPTAVTRPDTTKPINTTRTPVPSSARPGAAATPAARASTPAPAPAKPERSRFRALHRLWKHPLGEVSGGTDATTGARISVTALHPGSVMTDAMIEAARSAARVASGLSSSAVIKPIDVQRMPDGRVAIATEPFEGTPLTNVSRNQPMPVGRTIAIVRQILKVLATAHEVGLVHRALSLGSVILRARTDKPDTVAITDFALGPLLDGDVAVLKEDASLQPVTPERISGQQLDAREDLYLLGCIAYTLLTGGPPFRTGTAEAVKRRHAIEDPMPILDRLRGTRNIPAGLATWVHRCLSKEPDDRYADAPETEAALCLAQIEAHLQTPWDDLPPPDVDRVTSERIAAALVPKPQLPPEFDDELTVMRAPTAEGDPTVLRTGPRDADTTIPRASVRDMPPVRAAAATPPPPAPEPEPEHPEPIEDAPSTSIVLETMGEEIDRSPTVVTHHDETIARGDPFGDEATITEDDDHHELAERIERVVSDAAREREETIVGGPPTEETVRGHAPASDDGHDVTIRGPAPTAVRNDETHAGPPPREPAAAQPRPPASKPAPPVVTPPVVSAPRVAAAPVVAAPRVAPPVVVAAPIAAAPDPIDRTLVAPAAAAPDPIDRTLVTPAVAAPDPIDRTLVAPATVPSASAFEEQPTVAGRMLPELEAAPPSSTPTLPGAGDAPPSSTPTLPGAGERSAIDAAESMEAELVESSIVAPVDASVATPITPPVAQPPAVTQMFAPAPPPAVAQAFAPAPPPAEPAIAEPVAQPQPVAPPQPVVAQPVAQPQPVAPPQPQVAMMPPQVAAAIGATPMGGAPQVLPPHAAPPWPSNPSGMTGQYASTGDLDGSMIAAIGGGRRNIVVAAIIIGVAAVVVAIIMSLRPTEDPKPVAQQEATPATQPQTIRAETKPSFDPAADPAATASDLAASGDKARAEGRAADAEALYQRAIVREPQNVAALLGLGELKRAAGDLPKAAGYFRRAVGAAPKNGAARIALGDVLVQQNELAEAKKQYRKAKQLGHPDANARLASM